MKFKSTAEVLEHVMGLRKTAADAANLYTSSRKSLETSLLTAMLTAGVRPDRAHQLSADVEKYMRAVAISLDEKVDCDLMMVISLIEEINAVTREARSKGSSAQLMEIS